MPYNTVVRLMLVLCLMMQVVGPVHACERMAASDAMMPGVAEPGCHPHGVPAPDPDRERGACCGDCLIHLQLFGGVSPNSPTLEAPVGLWCHPGAQRPLSAFPESLFKPPRSMLVS